MRTSILAALAAGAMLSLGGGSPAEEQPQDERGDGADQKRRRDRNVDPRPLALDQDVARKAAEAQALAEQPDEADADQDETGDDQQLGHGRTSRLQTVSGEMSVSPTAPSSR